MNNTLKAHIALIAVNLIYGANYVIAKEATPEYILPFGFIFIRVTMGTLLLWGFHYLLCAFADKSALINKKIEGADLGKIAICALFGVAINQMLFFKGLSITSPINASLIMITAPIAALIFAAIIIKERITFYKMLGILLGAIGAGVIILFSHRGSAVVASSVLGDFLIFVNASSYALYLVLVKPLMERYHPFTILKWVFFFGFFYVTPFSFGEFQQIEWHTFPPLIWFCLAYVIIGTTFLAYILNIYALEKVNTSIVAIYIYTQPVIATLIAIGLGKDELSPLKMIAATFIFIGVALVSHQPKSLGNA